MDRKRALPIIALATLLAVDIVLVLLIILMVMLMDTVSGWLRRRLIKGGEK